MDDGILKTLLLKATGYSRDEVQEEYAVTPEGEMVLTKRKVTKKYYPPDSTALKTYLELSSERGTEELTDEELEAEKRRLLAELKESEKLAATDKSPHDGSSGGGGGKRGANKE